MTDAPRKLILAVQDAALCGRLSKLLASSHVDVVLDPDLDSTDPQAIEADVVVLRAQAVSPEEGVPAVLSSAGDADAPGVVVLGHDEDAGEEVRLVAAGATAVLDADARGADLADRLVELAEAEVDGGLDGPEAGGSVAQPRLADFQSRSPGMRDFLDVVRRVADSDTTLLVTGETGVGKERLARAIHGESARSAGAFVAVNCGALAENLLESELFGHEKGAFTGATEAREGMFRVADGGTIFLDEIGELPAHLQVKLLTVLQRHEIQPIGAREPVATDVRVIAATNRDLIADVGEGRFREDLFFRLNVVSLQIPPLRDRREDIPWLVGRFLRHFAEAHRGARGKGRGANAAGEVAEDAMDALLAYAWPGNVRELVNALERAVLLSKGNEIRLADLPESVRGGQALFEGSAGSGADRSSAGGASVAVGPAFLELPLQEAKRKVIEDFERRYLEHYLREHGGALGAVAASAGINPRTLYEKMRRLGLRKADYR